MSDYADRYIIRISEEDDVLRAGKLDQLEQLLDEDERAAVEWVIHPISAVIASLYDKNLANELEEKGYELLKQERNFRTTEEKGDEEI